jgi:hypothetical protein
MRIRFWGRAVARVVLAVTAVLAFCWPALAAVTAAAAGRTGAQGAGGSARVRPAGQLTRSWIASQNADRQLVVRVRARRACQAHSHRCSEAQGRLQRAGERLILDQRGFARAVSRTEGRAAAASARRVRRMRSPKLRSTGHTLRWSQVAGVRSYLLARHVPGQAVQYMLTGRRTMTPPPMPGAAVGYRVRTAVDGSSWSQEVTLSYPGPTAPLGSEAPLGSTAPPRLPDTQAAPVLSAAGDELSWTPVAGVGAYILRTVVPGAEQFTALARTSTTPPVRPGQTVSYSVRTAVVGSAWSASVTITYPSAPPPGETPVSPPEHSPPILGIVGGSGWGPQVAAEAIRSGFTSERLEADGPYVSDATSFNNGFRNDQVIVGNTPDGERLASVEITSWVNTALAQVREADSYGYTLLEVGNEMYLKGGRAEPVKYAEMYVALSRAMEGAGVTGVTLIFDSFGDYELPGGEESTIATGRGWLGDALKAEPGLKQRISAFSSHPYGVPGVKYTHGDWAIEGLEAQHAETVALGFPHTSFYATEYGEKDNDSSSPQMQAEHIRWAYLKMLALPWVRGIWYYQLHDDSTGGWGLVSGSFEPRPALAVLEGLIREGL